MSGVSAEDNVINTSSFLNQATTALVSITTGFLTTEAGFFKEKNSNTQSPINNLLAHNYDHPLLIGLLVASGVVSICLIYHLVQFTE